MNEKQIRLRRQLAALVIGILERDLFINRLPEVDNIIKETGGYQDLSALEDFMAALIIAVRQRADIYRIDT